MRATGSHRVAAALAGPTPPIIPSSLHHPFTIPLLRRANAPKGYPSCPPSLFAVRPFARSEIE